MQPLIDEQLVRAMPYPLAHLYSQMLAEPDAQRRFRGLIKVFAASLKYVCVLGIADYAQQPTSPILNATLPHSIERPALGTWLSFLRNIILHYRAEHRVFHVAELGEVLKRRGAEALLGHLVHLRNNYVHSDIWPPPDESAALYREELPHLLKVLTSFSFVADYPLVRRHAASGVEEAVMGPVIAPAAGSHHLLVRAATGSYLDITPFMLVTLDKDLGDLLLYETLIGKRAKYVLGNHVEWVVGNTEPGNRVAMLHDLVGRLADEEEAAQELKRAEAREELRRGINSSAVPVRMLRKLATRGHSENVLEEYTRARRYIHETYVPRQQTRRAFDELLGGTRNGLVIVADSGVGKSTEICRFFRERLRHDIVWILSGRTTRSESVFAEIEESLFEPDDPVNDIGTLLRSLDANRRDERLVIIFDGLNETTDPKEAFRQLNQLINSHPYPWLKVVVTCRSFAWGEIENSSLFIDHRRYVLAPDRGVGNLLPPFDADELRQAFAGYARYFNARYPPQWDSPGGLPFDEYKLLRSPLLVRLLFEGFEGADIPAALDLDIIFRRFSAQRLRSDRDLPFLERHLMTYFYRERTDVLDSGRLLDLRDGDGLQGSPVEREALSQLVEHICSEQVYEQDEVWSCRYEGCRRFGRPHLVEDEELPVCSACALPLELATVDNRSTYARLLSENILSQSERGGQVLVRLVFDRFFEYLMRRFCLVEKLQRRYDPAFIDELFERACSNGIFVEPLKGVMLDLWRQGDHRALYRVAEQPQFAAYHVLRTLFEDAALSDFSSFTELLRTAATESGFNENICRAGVHALLHDAQVAAAPETVELLTFLSRAGSAQVNEDAAEYLVALRRGGLDLITPLVLRCGALILADLGVLSGLRLAASPGRRRAFRGRGLLLIDVILCGLGNFFDDAALRGAAARVGLDIIQRILRHPALSLFEPLLHRFLVKWAVRIYREKGPLPCNYFEILFQLQSDREAIRRCGGLFAVDSRNLFDRTYEEFRSLAHSENGLVTWYILSLLPVHYEHAAHRGRALEHLRRFMLEGSEMDRYVVGQALSTLVRGPGAAAGLEQLQLELGDLYLAAPEQLFLHPQPLAAFAGAAEIVAQFRRQVEEAASKSGSRHYLPWIALERDRLSRFYINTAALSCARRRLERDHPNRLDHLLDILERNQKEDLLRFGDDLAAARLQVIRFIAQALGLAGAHGYLPQVFATVEEIIRTQLSAATDGDHDAGDQAQALRDGLVEALETIKEDHPQAVLEFVDRFDLDRPETAFLAPVKSSALAKEKRFSQSIYGNNVFQSGFSHRGLREVFGRFTVAAAEARNVEQFFLIYSRGVVRWLKNYDDQPTVPTKAAT